MFVMEMITCPACDAQQPSGATYCNHCGHILRPEEDDSAPVAGVAGARSAPRLIVMPDGFVVELATDRDAYIIGREDPGSGSHPEVDLVPFGGEEGGVSRRHARITFDDGAYFIEDLNSVNYTFVNKKRIDVGINHPLQNGDEIRLGRVLMRFETD